MRTRTLAVAACLFVVSLARAQSLPAGEDPNVWPAHSERQNVLAEARFEAGACTEDPTPISAVDSFFTVASSRTPGFTIVPPLEVPSKLGDGSFTQPVGGPEINRDCNGYDRQRCAAACGGSRTSKCLSVIDGIRYCGVCVPVDSLTENLRAPSEDCLQ